VKFLPWAVGYSVAKFKIIEGTENIEDIGDVTWNEWKVIEKTKVYISEEEGMLGEYNGRISSET
jgi:hypothetical protein